ncbi:meiotic recombination protein REC8 homolog [Parambassis ranga]|uniref:Meiotic recombination protein REC8 homolog n=1 Tax=Parambassis ranga TaxID=210632 RepID=A0A6P7JVT1_9TELE|nr:meiotic recombination protein REC8 homolog [Parambassis ranga]
MFYYPAVLNHRTGCFSTIWLVATKGIRVPRRDFLKVNVISTCDDIIKYLLERMSPPLPGLPRPRFSLYLSSQLQYGVIVVYHRQCSILLEELQSVVGQLFKKKTSQKIDLDVSSRQLQVLPDALSLLEEAEGAPDPLFGELYLQETLPSPNTLIQMNWERMRDASPGPPVAAAQEIGITAHPETITLRELEPAPVSRDEFEDAELDDLFQDTLDILLAQPDHFPEGDVEIPREEVTPEREVERQERDEREEERKKELTVSSIEVHPTTVSAEDALLSPLEEKDASVEEPRPPRDQLTPIPMPDLFSPPPAAKKQEKRWESLETEDVASPEVKTKRRRRRRQLTFFDEETQLPQEELQQQIDNPLNETSRPILALPPSPRVAELFNNPCNYLPEEVQFLWRQAAVITPVSDSDLQDGERGPESTDSDERIEVAETEEGRREPSLEKVPSDVAESEMFDISAPVTLPQKDFDQGELSREISSLPTSDIEESSIYSRTKLDIPEVKDQPVIAEAAESLLWFPDLSEDLLFQSILLPEASRRSVSSIFMTLLEKLTARQLCAVQDEPYGDIRISPGPEWEEASQSL